MIHFRIAKLKYKLGKVLPEHLWHILIPTKVVNYYHEHLYFGTGSLSNPAAQFWPKGLGPEFHWVDFLHMPLNLCDNHVIECDQYMQLIFLPGAQLHGWNQPYFPWKTFLWRIQVLGSSLWWVFHLYGEESHQKTCLFLLIVFLVPKKFQTSWNPLGIALVVVAQFSYFKRKWKISFLTIVCNKNRCFMCNRTDRVASILDYKIPKILTLMAGWKNNKKVSWRWEHRKRRQQRKTYFSMSKLWISSA